MSVFFVQFIPSENGKSLGKKAASRGSTAYEAKKALRIQDRELQEMSDAGMCLSMHQPWAHLLVKGIKMLVPIIIQKDGPGLPITHRCAYCTHYKSKGRIKHGYRGSPRTY